MDGFAAPDPSCVAPYRGLHGLDDSVSPGYEQIRIKLNVRADCPDDQLNDLIDYTQNHSPVCNTVCRPVPVHIERVDARGRA